MIEVVTMEVSDPNKATGREKSSKTEARVACAKDSKESNVVERSE